jgi:phosphomannomutase/phosphoglucomutase
VRRATAWFRARQPVVDIDGVRMLFEDGGRNVGWGLVRASNTGPVLVLRFEADSPERLTEIQTSVETRIQKIIAEVRSGP